jgi:hypothetical protein
VGFAVRGMHRYSPVPDARAAGRRRRQDRTLPLGAVIVSSTIVAILTIYGGFAWGVGKSLRPSVGAMRNGTAQSGLPLLSAVAVMVTVGFSVAVTYPLLYLLDWEVQQGWIHGPSGSAVVYIAVDGWIYRHACPVRILFLHTDEYVDYDVHNVFRVQSQPSALGTTHVCLRVWCPTVAGLLGHEIDILSASCHILVR